MRGHVRRRGSKWSIVYDESRDENDNRTQRWRSGFATKKEAREELTRVCWQCWDGLRAISTSSFAGRTAGLSARDRRACRRSGDLDADRHRRR